MPSFRDSLPEQDRWALAYYVLSLSAFKDPLTGEPLKISDADKKALDNPKLQANTPDDAYVPSGPQGFRFGIRHSLSRAYRRVRPRPAEE